MSTQTKEETGWNLKLQVITLLASIWAMFASTTGVLVQAWLTNRLPEWWAMLKSSLVFWILINGLCVLLVIYPACCAIRHLNKQDEKVQKVTV